MQAVTSLDTLSTSAGALADVFREHHARMLRAAHRITGNAQDAEDVLQTVFVRLLRRQAPITLSSDAGAYLQRSAVNAALDLVRTRQRTTVIPFDGASEQPASAAPSRLEYGLGEVHLREWLRARIAGLSPMAAEIFALRFFEDFTNHEIAALLGTSENSVAVTLHRTRARLREEIGEYSEYTGEDDD